MERIYIYLYLFILGVSVCDKTDICNVCECIQQFIDCRNLKLEKIPPLRTSLYTLMFIQADLKQNCFQTQDVKDWLGTYDHPKLMLDLRENTHCLFLYLENYEVC